MKVIVNVLYYYLLLEYFSPLWFYDGILQSDVPQAIASGAITI